MTSRGGCWWQKGVEISDEGEDGIWDGEGWYEKMQGGIYSARKRVGRIVFAADVFGMDCAMCRHQGRMNALEDVVGGSVVTSTFRPPINDTLVVSENLDMNVGGAGVQDGEDEQLKTDTLGPANVTAA